MKKFFYTLFAILAFAACSESDVDNNNARIDVNSMRALNFDLDGGEKVFSFSSTTAWTASIDSLSKFWCNIDKTSGPAGNAEIVITLLPNDDSNARIATLTISAGTANVEVLIIQNYDKDKERKALIVFYKALDGDNWKSIWGHTDIKNENWCSNAPISSWAGIRTNEKGRVTGIYLPGCNLTGNIPPEIGDLTELEVLQLNNNNITGELPSELFSLRNLKDLNLQVNKIEGEIPNEIENLTNLEYIRLDDNNIEGSIPQCLTSLTKLKVVQLGGTNISGEIPSEIGNLTDLETLIINETQISGSIPESLTQLKKLNRLFLSFCNLNGNIPSQIGNLTRLNELWLQGNYLTGFIPESLKDITNLKYLYLYDNQLSGEIPVSFYNWDFWKSWWGHSIDGNNFKFEDLTLPGPNAVVECFNGKIVDLENEYPQHKYTILFGWEENGIFTSPILPQIKKIYQTYSEDDVKIIGWGNALVTTKEKALEYIEQEEMLWDNFYYDPNDTMNPFKVTSYPTKYIESVTVVDSSGKIVFSNVFDDDIYRWDNYFTLLLENDFKGIDLGDIYESTDYSKDGEVKQLQKATKGKGIDVVLMGDAYSDRLIADGTYDRTMNVAMEKFFEKEPYKSFRDHFNVYSVTAVSKHEGYLMGSSTAIEGYFGAGTEVGGNNATVFKYGLKAIEEERMDDALFVVMMNSPQYAGTCYIYNPAGGDWGNGIATAYFPVGTDDEALGRLMHHEAAGHGFAKLGDEYQYEGTISAEEIESAQRDAVFGWWKNIDFTSDPTKVKWSYFLSDPRYANEGLGVYEGAFTYSIGAYRPTEDSIMRHNVGEFNAPSREAIYYRIHKLAYGADWEYDYEEFVKWDEKNRNKEQTRGIPYRLDIPKDFQPTHPPVVINKSWRDAR